MNYSQKTQNKAQEIQHLSDAFYEVKTTLTVLTALNMDAIGDKLGHSIQKVVYQAIDELEAIECKIDTDYTEKV
jgi:ABC-type transport system involved in cytochrome bd biosynthesis fused ATPase/permease subunit